MLFLLKDTSSVEDENCTRHVDLFVPLFPRAITNELPSENFNTSQFFHSLLTGFAYVY